MEIGTSTKFLLGTKSYQKRPAHRVSLFTDDVMLQHVHNIHILFLYFSILLHLPKRHPSEGHTGDGKGLFPHVIREGIYMRFLPARGEYMKRGLPDFKQ